MREYAKTRCLFVAASILAMVFTVAPTPFSSLSDRAHAQNKSAAVPKTTTSTNPDSTYGEGGSLTTVSNAQFKLLRETFKDKNGTTRETRLYPELGEGQVTVILYDENGKRVGSYDVGPVRDQWIIDMYGPDGVKISTEKLSKDEALNRGLDASRQFAMTGEYPPLVKTNVEQPKLQQADPFAKTKVEQPQLLPADPFNKTPPTESKTGANGAQGAAPKTCGEIQDRETLLAMGCDSRPAPRTTVAAPRPSTPAVAPTTNRSQSDCLSDLACYEQLKAQEFLREHERTSGSGRGSAAYPPVDLPVPGGMPAFPGK
jgi:hypothetical protein